MNSDEIKSLVIKVLIMIFTSLATTLHINGDQVTAVATDLADLGTLAVGVWMHWNMVKVPELAKETK